MDGWMNGWMDGCMDGWMDGWMNGWMDGRLRIQVGQSKSKLVKSSELVKSSVRKKKNKGA